MPEYEAKLELRKTLETFDALLEVQDKEFKDKINLSIDGLTTLLSKTMAPFCKMEFPLERKFRYSPGTIQEDKPCSTDEMNIQT